MLYLTSYGGWRQKSCTCASGSPSPTSDDVLGARSLGICPEGPRDTGIGDYLGPLYAY